MAFGIARDEAELAGEILDVVDDEREAAVELVEAPCLGQRGLPLRLGEMARDLPPRHRQHVVILPVEPAIDRRTAEQHEPREPLAVDQRHARPDRRVGDQPRRRVTALVLAGSETGGRSAQCVTIEDARRLFDHARETRVETARYAIGPAAGTGRFYAAALGRHQQPGDGRFGDVGEGTLDPPGKRVARLAFAQRMGEAQPLVAIIIAVAEQVLGDLQPQPAARAAPRHQQHRREGGAEGDDDARHPGIGDAQRLDRG